MFQLTENQHNLLAAARAWQEEGERRFEYWSRRETQAAVSEAFQGLLETSGLRSGKMLDTETRAQMLRLVSEISPNTNLSRRLYSKDAQEFDERLRRLLFSDESLENRLRQFLAVRGTGTQTASSLLAAYAPALTH